MSTSTSLDDEITAVLRECPDGVSGTELTRRLHRRKTEVFAVLRDDPAYRQTGLGPFSKWYLAAEGDGDGDGNRFPDVSSPNPGAGTSESSEAGETRSRCSEPERHAGNRAHWRDEEGVTWCVVCDVVDIRPLTFEEWLKGRGGQDERDRFEADWAAFNRGETTSEQIERLRLAFEVVA